jgi:phenylalanyl-tRNA synthetase alpha chain
MVDQISKIKLEYLTKIRDAKTLAELDQLFLSLFGKSGVITLIPKEFPKIEKAQLAVIVPAFTQAKSELEQAIEQKRLEIREASYAALSQETIDLNQMVELPKIPGVEHPLMAFEQEIKELFARIGFQQFGAPHIDTDFYNFEVLNIPDEHPARDLWDTLYIDKSNLKERKENWILRTHTSNAQVRIMKKFKPPVRMMVIDRCFRYENLDARHEHTFDQFELVFIDKGLSMAHLQWLSEYFLKTVLGEETKVRLRPKYYPFVEPGVGIDGTCLFCKGEGCKVCGGIGWLELGGAGMIHPTVLKNGGIDPNEYSGIAWGPGLERILMLKQGVEDLRLFRNGDLNFIREKGAKK